MSRHARKKKYIQHLNTSSRYNRNNMLFSNTLQQFFRILESTHDNSSILRIRQATRITKQRSFTTQSSNRPFCPRSPAINPNLIRPVNVYPTRVYLRQIRKIFLDSFLKKGHIQLTCSTLSPPSPSVVQPSSTARLDSRNKGPYNICITRVLNL